MSGSNYIIIVCIIIAQCHHNMQGIIISNHGGRQLDGVPATIDVLGIMYRKRKLSYDNHVVLYTK